MTLWTAGLSHGCGTTPDTSSTSAANGTASDVVACSVSSSEQPTCSSPEPSYAGQVKDIIDSTCQSCHASGGVGAVASGGGGGRPNDGNQPAGATTSQDSNHRPPNFDSDTAHDWSVFSNIQRSQTKMMQMLFLCQMPPPDASTLKTADRKVLMSWLKCGAKDN